MENKKILLSIALMVSNRKDTIQKCLDSLTPIRQQIPCELIILDTGCDKELREILEEYGDIVKSFTWCNDFSKARNETLKFASGEWYLYLDDDEWFVDTEELIDFFKTGEYLNYNYASYIQRNYLDMQGSQYSDAWVSRMIKRTPETHFESRIHEYLAPMSGNCKGIRSIVDHYGYVYETDEALWKHYERNKSLLKEMIKEEPENLRWRIHLAQEYRTVKEYGELFRLGEDCLELVKDRDSMYDNIYLGCFYGAKILAYKEYCQHREGVQECQEALMDSRNTQLFLAFCALCLANFYYWLGEYALSKDNAQNYLRLYEFFQNNEPVWYVQKNVPFVGECFDAVMQKEIYSELICIDLKQGNYKVLEQYLDKLEWEGRHLYVFEDIVPTLISAMNKQDGETEVFSPVLKLMFGNSALWDYFCDEVQKKEASGSNMHNIMTLIKEVLPEAVAEPVEEGSAKQDARNVAQGDMGEVQMTPEMQQLAASVKAQIQQLLENGMVEQAKDIIAQVRKILPEDEELKEMEKQLASFKNSPFGSAI